MGRSYGLLDPDYGRRDFVKFSDETLEEVAMQVSPVRESLDDTRIDIHYRLVGRSEDGYTSTVEFDRASREVISKIGQTASHS